MKRLATGLVALGLIASAGSLLAANPPGGNNNPHNRAFYVPHATQSSAAAPSAGYIIGVPNYGGYGYQTYSYPSYGYRNYGYNSRGRYVPNYGAGYGYGGPVITDARAFGFANPF